jgi:type II secretory pathway component GspD/PulD (secretin)
LGKFKFFPGVNDNIISQVGGGNGGNTTTTTTPGGSQQTTVTSFTGAAMKMAIVDLNSLTVVLRALVAHAEARFLGKPKVLTLNNKTASIQITQDQAVAQQVSITGAQGVAQSNTTVERHETGVKLLVTPQVNKEGYITMLVQPQYTNVVESSVSSASNPVFDPLTRRETTLVRVKSGQTLVLGGLLSSTETKQVRKVPFFGYIPIIGWLFTSSRYQRNNTDLVIFLTPTIVND